MAKRVKVAIDLRDLKKAKTGTFTYLNEITKALELKKDVIDLVLIKYPFDVYTGGNYFLKAIEHLLFFFWKQIVLPAYCFFKKCDVLFCTDYFSPVIRLKTRYFVVFHDCFFFDHPSYYNPIWRASFKILGVAGAKKAEKIITPSNYVKARLGKLVPALHNKIKVVYEGHADFDQMLEQPLSKIENNLIQSFLTNRKYILYVGTLDRRKNIDRLIMAYEKLPQEIKSELVLIVAGSSPAYKGSDYTYQLRSMIKSSGLEKNIFLTGRVAQHMLKKLYQEADFLIQPSIDEGFGLPIVEALHFEIPFAAANNTAMPEIGGDAGIYFDPFDMQQITETIIRLYHNDTLKKELIQNGKKLKEQYNWNLAADHLLDIFMSNQRDEA
jgi:glycosyltransferase involved in cell wall biosynthesis